MHRGQITVRSQEGVGTTFIIQLPIKLLTVPMKTSEGTEKIEDHSVESEKIL
jgi:hypothetical protein